MSKTAKVYVADAGNNSIAVISTDTWKISDTIPLQGSPDQLLLYDSGEQMYWSDAEAGTISLLDLRTKQNIGTVQVGGAPRYLASDPDRQFSSPRSRTSTKSLPSTRNLRFRPASI